MSEQPKGRKRKLTDEELRQALGEGKKAAQIAREWEISPSAVSKRIKGLDTATMAAAVQPAEAREFVSRTLDVVGVLQQNIERNQLLMDACHAWLRDADDPTKYDISARSEEVTITHTVIELGPNDKPVARKVKHTLAQLLDQLADGHVMVERTEFRHADPRKLILDTLGEARQTAMAFTEVLEKVILAQRMERFQGVLVREIEKVAPDVAQRIAEAIRRSHLLCSALGGDPALPA